MTPADQIAQEILDYACARLDITLGTRADLKRFIAKKIQPLAPEQATLKFTEKDLQDFKADAQKILKFLRERRSAGVFNYELKDFCCNPRARISDLRKQGFGIKCERGPGRTNIYRLHPADW